MLAYPQWPVELGSEGCRGLRWVPPARFAPYVARPFVLRPPPPLQIEDEDSSGGSSPERDTDGNEVCVCSWRGCGAHFLNVSRLSAHVARSHALPHQDGLFYCGWRGCTRPQRGFNARYKMLVHVRTHTNERPHTCTQCQKSFSRAENLKIHLRSHSGEKPYVCPYEGCGKAYSNSSDRFKHTRTHTVDKPYFCKLPGCNKRYTDPSSLRKHVKTYKHFTPKITNEPMEREVENRQEMPSQYVYERPSIVPVSSPIRSIISPTLTTTYTNVPQMKETSQSLGSPLRYSPITEQITYIKPIEPLYPLRLPTYEMSYLEYTQMYEHAYGTYYSNSIPVPQSIYEKSYTYETTSLKERPEDIQDIVVDDEDMPLNLKCDKQIVRPIEDSMEYQLVKCMDVPLDLSTKT